MSYQASGNNAQLTTVKVQGTKLITTGMSSGTASISVTDNAGTHVTIDVIVPISPSQYSRWLLQQYLLLFRPRPHNIRYLVA